MPSEDYAIAADSESFYWADSHRIWKMPLAGGEATLLATVKGLALAMAVDETHLYLAVQNRYVPATMPYPYLPERHSEIVRFPKQPGGTIEHMTNSMIHSSSHDGFVVEDSWILYADGNALFADDYWARTEVFRFGEHAYEYRLRLFGADAERRGSVRGGGRRPWPLRANLRRSFSMVTTCTTPGRAAS